MKTCRILRLFLIRVVSFTDKLLISLTVLYTAIAVALFKYHYCRRFRHLNYKKLSFGIKTRRRFSLGRLGTRTLDIFAFRGIVRNYGRHEFTIITTKIRHSIDTCKTICNNGWSLARGLEIFLLFRRARQHDKLSFPFSSHSLPTMERFKSHLSYISLNGDIS